MSTTRTASRGARGPDSARRLTRRGGAGALGALMALGALPLVATPAAASLTGPEVDRGENITVFHNIDMVAVFGVGAVGDVVTVQVIREGNEIGTATGPLVDTDDREAGDQPGLEVNHGVDGTPAAGDCWTGTAPNVSPKDQIVVRNHRTGDLDQVTVDEIRFTGREHNDATGQVLLHGIAKRFDGSNIDPDALDSGEFRAVGGKFRAAPNDVVARPGVDGGFTAIYTLPYAVERNRDNLTNEQMETALATQDGHAIGFGHTDPLPLESMLVDGLGEANGPAEGCPGGPAPEPGEPEIPDPTPNPIPGPVDPAPAPTTRTVTVYASADTMVRQHSPRSSYGRSSTLQADQKATDSDRSRETAYVKFAIPELRSGESVTGAKLHLNITNGTDNGPLVRRTSTGWSESMTWSSGQPSVSGQSANFGRLSSGKKSIGLSLAGIAASQTVSYQFYAESRDGLGFSSRESSTTGNRPYMVLTVKKG